MEYGAEPATSKWMMQVLPKNYEWLQNRSLIPPASLPESFAASADEMVKLLIQLPERPKYNERQWSPTKTDGKRVYNRSFLLNLINHPHSLKKPDFHFHHEEFVLSEVTHEFLIFI